MLRVWNLNSLPGLNGDEAWYGVQALRWLSDEPTAWTTPTGNPVNVFFFLPLAALHAMFPPSIGLLRSVAAASGLAALAVNYGLCRRLQGTRSAVLTTLALAVLPINIAYSRFAWDASQSLLATTVVVYASLLAVAERKAKGRWLLVAAVGTVVALAVHPTNVFTLPFPVFAAVVVYREQVMGWWRRASRFHRRSMGSVGVVCVACGIWLLRGWLSVAAGRLTTPAQVPRFLQSLVQLLDGTTVYRFISGSEFYDPTQPLPWWQDFNLVDLAAWLIVGLVARQWIRHRVSRHRAGVCPTVDSVLLFAWIATVVGFFLVAGPEALAPHFERYGICLVAPTMVVLLRGVSLWLGRTPAGTHALAVGSLLFVGCGLLISFQTNYVGFILRTGGRSHNAFRTASVEPKQQVWETIKRNSPPNEPVRVVTETWWNQWPLAYLVHGQGRVRIGPWSAMMPDTIASGDALSSRDAVTRGWWFVEFHGTPEEAAAKRRLTGLDLAWKESTIRDYSGRPLLTVLEVLPR